MKTKYFLLHNNAPAHITLIAQIFILQKEVTKFDHPSRSPGLIPTDFFLFQKLKMKMKVILYHPKHPKECDRPSQGDSFGGISRMLSTTKSCIEVHGDYSE
jgi:hypothetical protein